MTRLARFTEKPLSGDDSIRITLRILREAKRYWKYMLLTVISIFTLTAAQLYAPIVIRELSSMVERKSPDLAAQSWRLALILFAVYLVQAIFTGIRSYFSHHAAWHFVSDMRVKVYDHYQSLSLKYFHDKQTGQLMSRIVSDTVNLELLIAHAAPDLVVNIFIFAGVAILLFNINAHLALVCLAVLPPLAVSAYWFATKVRPKFRVGQKAMGELNAVLQDNLSGIREIQAFNNQHNERENVKKASYEHINALLNALKLSAVYHPSVQFFSSVGMVFVIGYGGYLASLGQVTISDIIAFILYLNMFYQPITAMARINEDIQNALAGAERIFEVLDSSSEVKDSPHAVNCGALRGDVRFNDVSFKYNEDGMVLKNINVSAEAGQSIALVGKTGVGKTTMAMLLSRFYDPTEGSITIDGRDIRDFTLDSLRNNISIVMQDVFLFNGTIAENIAYGKQDATEEEIINAARLARADEFIDKMEDGYDTFIGERGVKLSGGQKQRLSIARAILRDKPILILDEATASVDVETESFIQEAMDVIMKGRTTIIIAHRLSTIKKADNIYVLKDGSVTETGTHEQLEASGGLYRAYTSMQA